MERSRKRAKVEVDSTISLIYIIPNKIQKRRLDILVTKSREKGLPITDSFWYVCINHTGIRATGTSHFESSEFPLQAQKFLKIPVVKNNGLPYAIGQLSVLSVCPTGL